MSDLISRKAVLDYPIRLDHYDEEHGNLNFVLGIESVMEYVESLPSAEPKTGKWIQKDMYADRFCSKCKYAVWDSEAEEYNFCPNCGARMLGEDGEA